MQAKAAAEKLMAEVNDLTTGTKHQREVEKMGAQARGNRDLEITKALTKGEVTPGNLEAAVGFNTIKEAEDQRQAAPKLGSGFNDPRDVPPELAGQQLPIGPLSTQ